MEAKKVKVAETVSASKKLQAADGKKLLAGASSLTVAKGKKVTEFSGADLKKQEAVDAMLGPTGNLRAPTIIVGKKVLVGFNEEVFAGVF